MTTKKAETTAQKTGKLERGRFASVLAPGFTIEVTPSGKLPAPAAGPAPESKPPPSTD